MNRVYIVAGGPSLDGFDFKRLRNYNTIVINKAIEHVPNPNYFITIDHSFMTHKVDPRKIQNTKATKFFVANFGSGSLQYIKGTIKDVKNNIAYDLSPFDVIIKSERIDGMGFSWNDFRSGNNSGYCALQLAILMGFDEIYLLGVDLELDGGKTHYHKGYRSHPAKRMKQNLIEYKKHFIKGVAEAKEEGEVIISCSPNSALNGIIPYTKLSEAL